MLAAEKVPWDFQRSGLEEPEPGWEVCDCNVSLQALICVAVWAHQGGNESPHYWFLDIVFLGTACLTG